MSTPETLWPGGPQFRQAEHFRLGTDSILLADFVKTDGAARGIDLGCGSGILMLLLGEKRPLPRPAAQKKRSSCAAKPPGESVPQLARQLP